MPSFDYLAQEICKNRISIDFIFQGWVTKMIYKNMQLNKKRQGGFTLVEIAIVLMIIGLLIGGMLRGQELITSARVRNLIDQKNAIQTAQIGFLDRYRWLPGDLTPAQGLVVGNSAGGFALGVPGTNGGGDTLIPIATNSALTFQNLSAAGFLSCATCGELALVAATSANSPTNVFGGVVRIGQAPGSAGPVASNFYNVPAVVARMVLATGAGIESTILREVDMKGDDGLPGVGNFRYGNFDTPAGLGPCTIAGVPVQWVTPTATNCEGAWLL
jgi:prepilin-type N-terminal cleavage/methylation domain-containing protein